MLLALIFPIFLVLLHVINNKKALTKKLYINLHTYVNETNTNNYQESAYH